MLDSRATNTFVIDKLVKQLGLQLCNSKTMMNTMNAKAQKITEMDYSVFLVLEMW